MMLYKRRRRARKNLPSQMTSVSLYPQVTGKVTRMFMRREGASEATSSTWTYFRGLVGCTFALTRRDGEVATVRRDVVGEARHRAHKVYATKSLGDVGAG